MADGVQAFDGGKLVNKEAVKFTKHGNLFLRKDSDGLMATVKRARLIMTDGVSREISWEDYLAVQKALIEEKMFVVFGDGNMYNTKYIASMEPYETREANEEIEKEYGHLIEGWKFTEGGELYHEGLSEMGGKIGMRSYRGKLLKVVDGEEYHEWADVYYDKYNKIIHEIRVWTAESDPKVIWRRKEI